jgi:hypothetical protein
MKILIAIIATTLASVSLCQASEGRMRIIKTAEGYQFFEAEAPVLFYRTVPKATAEGSYSRANYCHPIYGLDGQILTEDFPKDHPHHRGVFWGWHQVYVGNTPMGDMWACEDFARDIRTVQILPPRQDAAALKADVYWESSRWKNGLEPFARETVTIRVHQVTGDTRLIDFDIEILALEEGLRIGGSNDVKGYGGFSTRIVLPPDIQMSDHDGPVIPQNEAVAAGDWMDFSGTFGNTASKFAILVHPSNPGHPRQWILRASGSAQNVAYPGREPIPISTTSPLVLKYRLVLHKNADLNQLFSQYSQLKAEGTPSLNNAATHASLQPTVEIEEDVYDYEPANNGAGPMWCHGSTCLVRTGDDLFASGLETIGGAKPLNNCRWMLFWRGSQGWRKVDSDASGRTREPSPLAGFPDGQLFLSANPTLNKDPNAYSGPAKPELLQFDGHDPSKPSRTLIPVWSNQPKFTEHSYRSFAADGPNRELILFQNIGYTHAEWTFLDRQGQWSAQGQLKWPWGADYSKPQPIRVCYPNVALRNREAHFCGVSDIVEPNEQWRAFKKQLTGQEWDYDFRRLFYTWSPDITTGRFQPWVQIASREKTCGWINPGDLWVAPDGKVHILWTERAIDERLRDKFFPGVRQSHSLNYAILRQGEVLSRHTLLMAEEGKSNERPGGGRFHVTPDNRLFVFFYVSGSDSNGRHVSENRMLEILRDGPVSDSVRVPLARPFTDFMTATPRAGSPPSRVLELLGIRQGLGTTISFARIKVE